MPGRGSAPETRIPVCRECCEELCTGICIDYLYDRYTRMQVTSIEQNFMTNIGIVKSLLGSYMFQVILGIKLLSEFQLSLSNSPLTLFFFDAMNYSASYL